VGISMPIANTVEATIVVNFEDKFTDPAFKAFEQFRTHAESVFRAVCFSGVAAFEKLKAAQQEALKFTSGPGKPDVSFLGDMLNVLGSVASIVSLLGVSWQLVLERMRSLGSFIIGPFMKALRPLLQALSNLRLALPAIIAGFTLLTPVLASAALSFAGVAGRCRFFVCHLEGVSGD
jgi:hypothetical protein